MTQKISRLINLSDLSEELSLDHFSDFKLGESSKSPSRLRMENLDIDQLKKDLDEILELSTQQVRWEGNID